MTAGGRTWLQYWLFYYYNPQNVLGLRRARGRLGVRAGRARHRRRADRRDLRPARRRRALRVEPGAADLRGRAGRLRRARVARVVLRVGRRLARAASGRLPPRRRLPRAPAARGRHAVDAVHGLARDAGAARRRARSRRAGRASWIDPAGFESTAAACTAPSSARRPRRAGHRDRPCPRRGCACAALGGEGRRRLPLPCRAAAARHPAGERRARGRAGRRDGPARPRSTPATGTVRLAVRPSGPVVVQASAFSRRGTRSAVKLARLP